MRCLKRRTSILWNQEALLSGRRGSLRLETHSEHLRVDIGEDSTFLSTEPGGSVPG